MLLNTAVTLCVRNLQALPLARPPKFSVIIQARDEERFIGLCLQSIRAGGLFWCIREDFEAIGGFNANLVSGEDVDFAKRLKAYGKRVGRPFSTLSGAHIVSSCRKFDAFGDCAFLGIRSWSGAL
jgi:hypothetical protein